MDSLKNTVGAYLIKRLEECGLAHVFGVPGDFVLRFMDYIVASERMELVTTCNELNAGYAADAYGKLHGIAAVCVTYNVGGMSLINAAVGAAAESVPLIIISGAPSREAHRGRLLMHHTNGNLHLQRNIYSQFCAAAVALDDPQTTGAVIDKALQTCFARKQPVYIEVPLDMVDLPLALPQQPLVIHGLMSTHESEKHDNVVNEIFKRLSKAKRPVVLAGNEIPRFELAGVFREFVDGSGLPYLTTMGAKGIIEESHPSFFGNYAGALFCSCAQRYLENSDFVLNLGADLSDIDMSRREELVFPGVSVRNGLVQYADGGLASIQLNELMIGLSLRFGVKGKALGGRAPESLCENAGGGCPFWQYKNEAGQAAACLSVIDEKPDAQLTAALLFKELRRFVTKDMLIVSDVGEALLSSIELPVMASGGYVTQPLYLSIGYSIPATLGAAMLRRGTGKRVVTLVGDGALQMTAQELSTIARYRLNPIIILLNNDGYAIERAIHDGPYNDLQPWSYQRLPGVFSDRYFSCQVTTPLGFADALAQALLHTEGPSFIEAVLDPKAISQPLKNLGASLANKGD